MLQYIWIPSVVLVGIFILALCFYFYSEYDCCICKRKTPKPRYIPDEAELESVVALKDDHKRETLEPPAASSLQPSAPIAVPSPDDVFVFKHGTITSRELFRVENDMPVLDLHNLAVDEARDITRSFLRAHSKTGPLAAGAVLQPHGNVANKIAQANAPKTVKIIVGRGIHSKEGIPVLKPMVQNIVQQRNLKFELVNKGGAFLIHL